jgi:hypothetical protein
MMNTNALEYWITLSRVMTAYAEADAFGHHTCRLLRASRRDAPGDGAAGQNPPYLCIDGPRRAGDKPPE